MQTASVLIGSISLVVIALDRYLAVLNKSKIKILRNKIFCFFGLFLVWFVSCAISSPMLFSYELIDIYVIPEDHEADYYVAYLCMTDMVLINF